MRKLLTLLAVVGISFTSLNAGDNSRATMGDIKEATYKLIKIVRAQDKTNDKFDSRVSSIEKASQGLFAKNEKDKYDLLIDEYVASNSDILNEIEK